MLKFPFQREISYLFPILELLFSGSTKENQGNPGSELMPS